VNYVSIARHKLAKHEEIHDNKSSRLKKKEDTRVCRDEISQQHL